MRSCTRRELRTRLDEKIQELTDPEHVCQDCGKMFETKAAWAGHRQKHIAEEQDPVTCEICGETFANEWAYIGHQQTHLSDGDPVACGICGDEFRNEADFNIHKQTHLGQRTDPVECGECGKECRNQRMLKIHKGRKHGGSDDEKPDAVRASILQELRRKHYRPIAKIADEHDVPPEYVAYLDESKREAGGHKCLLCGELFDTEHGVGVHLRSTHDKAGEPHVVDRYSVAVNDVGETLAAAHEGGG